MCFTTGAKVTDLADADLVAFAIRLSRQAPRDPESWLCLAYAYEASVWGLQVLENFPSTPWVAKHPKMSQHLANLRGDPDVSLVAGGLADGEPTTRVMFLDHVESSRVEELADGSIVGITEVTARPVHRRAIGQLGPEIFGNDLWHEQLGEGLIGDRVRENPGLARFDAREAAALRRAVSAYCRAAEFPLTAASATLLVSGAKRLIRSEFLAVALSPASPLAIVFPQFDNSEGLGDDESRTADLGAARLVRLILANTSMPDHLRIELEFSFEVERAAPGFDLDRSPAGCLANFNGSPYRLRGFPDRLRDVTSALLAQTLDALVSGLPCESFSQFLPQPGKMMPALPVLDSEVRARFHERKDLASRAILLATLLAQLETGSSRLARAAWLCAAERWRNARDGTAPFAFQEEHAKLTIEDAGYDVRRPDPVPTRVLGLLGEFVSYDMLFNGDPFAEDGRPARPWDQRDIAELNRLLDVVAPFQ